MMLPDLMLTVGIASFGIGAGLYAILATLLLTSWRGRLQGGLLLAAALLTMLWAFAAGSHLGYGLPTLPVVQVLELVRNLTWFLFLLRLLDHQPGHFAPTMTSIRWGLIGLVVLPSLLYGAEFFQNTQFLPNSPLQKGLTVAHAVIALIGAALVEQLFRHTPKQHRWSIKYLCFGVGGMFAYDFYAYADALLFGHADPPIWLARGFITGLTAPLVAVTAARNPEWSVNVYVSRGMLLRSTTVIVAAMYLLMVAVAGYYVQLFGGAWGSVLRNVVVYGSLVLLAIVFFSEKIRASVRLFLAKNFYQNKYEYGEEWLRFTDRLGNRTTTETLPKTVVFAIRGLLNSPGGALWLRDGATNFKLAASDAVDTPTATLALADSVVAYLEKKEEVLLLSHGSPEEISLSKTVTINLTGVYDAWLVAPLLHGADLLGIVILTKSLTSEAFDAEDRSLMRAVGRQAASYLALLAATEKLAQNRQFEAYNRFSAFLVHDLKNVVAQLAMVVSNATKHRHNPLFFDDAIATVQNAVDKMNKILSHLRERTPTRQEAALIEVSKVLRTVVERRSQDEPMPQLEIDEEALVYADGDRLESVIAHFVQNAQEATPSDGKVEVRLQRDLPWCIVSIVDNGSGMSPEFIRNRLFRPFHTTKGNAGMGIGVFEGREFARSLGGDVNVTSELGVGTRFEIRLPLDTTPVRAAASVV